MTNSAPYSHHIFTVSNMTPGIPPQSDRSGCWLCRFRRKRCIPNPGGRCVDCFKFNMDCIGQGIDRPSGKELAEQVRAETKVWIKDRAKHDPSVPPLDLSYLWTPSLPSPASTPSATSPGPVTPNLDWDDTSIIINHSLFPVPETDSLLVQEIDITYPVSSNTLDEVPSSHGGITSPKMDWWAAKAACNVTTSIPPNHTQLPHHTQHPPPSTPIPAEAYWVAHDHHRGLDQPFFSVSFLSSVHDGNVPQATLDQSGALGGSQYHPYGGANAVTFDQQLPHPDFGDELDLTWNPPLPPR